MESPIWALACVCGSQLMSYLSLSAALTVNKIRLNFLQVELELDAASSGVWFQFLDISDALLVRQVILTLKHMLVLVVVPQSSGHFGSGVVVGSGGRVTPSAQCLHTNFAFSSQLKTSHKPPATPVFIATHPAFRPAVKQKVELNQWVAG